MCVAGCDNPRVGRLVVAASDTAVSLPAHNTAEHSAQPEIYNQPVGKNPSQPDTPSQQPLIGNVQRAASRNDTQTHGAIHSAEGGHKDIDHLAATKLEPLHAVATCYAVAGAREYVKTCTCGVKFTTTDPDEAHYLYDQHLKFHGRQ